jgi:pentatricopeptide repeat protein
MILLPLQQHKVQPHNNLVPTRSLLFSSSHRRNSSAVMVLATTVTERIDGIAANTSKAVSPHLCSRAKRGRHTKADMEDGARTTSTATPSITTSNMTSTTLDSKWRTMTDEILGLPVGNFNHGRWNEAIHILTYWFGNPDGNTVVAIEQCWKVLDRLCVELEETNKINNNNGNSNSSIKQQKQKSRGRPPPILSTSELLNPILRLWRDYFFDYHRNKNNSCSRSSSSSGSHQSDHHRDRSSIPSLPSSVAKQLRRYQKQNLIAMDSATHSIVLDAAAKYSAILSQHGGTLWGKQKYVNDEETSQKQLHSDNNKTNDGESQPLTQQFHHREGILFADRYLRDWINNYRNHQHPNDSRIVPPRPDVVAFGTLVHGWVESGLPGAPVKAEAWVKILDDLERRQQHRNNTANTILTQSSTNSGSAGSAINNEYESREYLYTTVLLAWARAGNPVKAKEWIDRMIREEEYPDIIGFNTLLMAYQTAASKADIDNKSNNYAERTEEILRHMQKLYDDPNGFLSEPPNAFSYNLVIDSWAKRAHNHDLISFPRKETAIDAAKRAHVWFEQMKNAGIPPDTISYNAVITAYSRAGFPQESEKLMQEMISEYQNNQHSSGNGRGNNGRSPTSHHSQKSSDVGLFDEKYALMTTTKPDVRSFTSILAGWARVGTLEAAERADELLRVMQLPEVDIEPNVETYGSCIHCWARVLDGSSNNAHRNSKNNKSHQGRKHFSRDQREHAVNRAESLFREMREDRNLSPNVHAYTGLLNVYGRSGRSRKAHAFLEECLDEYDRTGDLRMKPTVVTFTAILNAWSKGFDAQEAPEKAHELLRRMKDQYGIKPNAFSYSSVLNCYSRSDHPEAATKALSLFRDMREVAGLEPNIYTCSNVLKAMARGGMVEEAESLLLALVHDKGVSAKLNSHAFSSVLYGWSKAKHRDAPERAEALLVEMQELYRRKMIDEPPNSICWNNVLACWAHSDLPGAAQRADDLLKRIRQQQQQNELKENQLPSAHHKQPRRGGGARGNASDHIMYNTVMNAWANNGNFEKANELYLELLEQHRLDASLSPPDEWTYRALWKSIVKSHQMGAEEKLRHFQTVVQSMADVGLEPSKDMKAVLERFRRNQQNDTTAHRKTEV